MLISVFYIRRCCVAVFLEASLTHWSTIRKSSCGLSVQCISSRNQDSAFSHPYFQIGDETSRRNWKLLVLFLLYKREMAQHLQLQWGSLCHYSRQTCWMRTVQGADLFHGSTFLLHFCMELRFQRGQESTKCFMAGDTEFQFIFCCLCYVLL